MEIRYGTPTSDYDSLHIFGCSSYYHVLENKLKLRSKKIIFLGFSSGVKGYCLWYSLQKKIIVSMDVVLSDDVMLKIVSQKMEFGS